MQNLKVSMVRNNILYKTIFFISRIGPVADLQGLKKFHCPKDQ